MTTHTSPRPRSASWARPPLRRLAAGAALLLLLGACGSDDEPEPDDLAPAASSTSSSVAPSPSSEAEPASDELINPCDPAADPAETAVEGDVASFETPVLDVVALESRFVGVPPVLPTGPYGFRLVGAGDEFHELALIRVKAGEDRSVRQLIDATEAGGKADYRYLGGVVACPGLVSPEPLGVELEPGRYAMVDLVPVGTTPDLEGEDLLAAYENPSHYTQGMIAEFRVR